MQHSPPASSSSLLSAERASSSSSSSSCPASVKIIETDVSIRCGLKTDTIYELMIGPYRIELQQDHKVLFDWPFNYIRRFGYTTQSFSFEVGSKASSGEGMFIFKTKRARIIYDQILANVDCIKRQRLTTTTTPEAIASDGQGPGSGIESKHQLSTASIPHIVHNNSEYAQVVKGQRRAIVPK